MVKLPLVRIHKAYRFSHERKRQLLFGRKTVTDLDKLLKVRTTHVNKNPDHQKNRCLGMLVLAKVVAALHGSL